MSDVLITIDITAGVEYGLAEVWPDGDAPERPTAQDVAEVLAAEGISALIRDWGILDGGVRACIGVTTSAGRRTYADVTL